MKPTKNTRLNIRLTNAERQTIKLKAKENNISVSEMILKNLKDK
tara:strand:+ start:1245 stop:1376 length:132 start_codon:yes stop_codon:yes gene_type:complete